MGFSNLINQCVVLVLAAAATAAEDKMADLQFGLQGPSILAFPHQAAVTLLAQSQNNFTRALYTQVSKSNSGNLFFSPFSVMAALGMAFTGAASTTKEQLKSVLFLSQSDRDLHNAFHDLLSHFKKGSEDYQLHSSNLAYVSSTLPVVEEYSTLLAQTFISPLRPVDFGASEAVREEINKAVEEETASNIKDLLPPGVINSMTKMVLVNAVYFKGLWEQQFDEANTRLQDFWTSKDTSVKTPMMHMYDQFQVANREDLGASVLTLDYKGSRLSLVVVLPFTRDGLAEVEAKLAKVDLLSNLDQNLGTMKIELSIPKFSLKESLDLIDHLKGMGVSDLFDSSSCDLSGISESKDLFVSQVLHKAVLEVNEKGSEAAAATGVVMMARSMPPQFTADHPFLFYIRDQQSGLLLFAGRLINPESHVPKDEL